MVDSVTSNSGSSVSSAANDTPATPDSNAVSKFEKVLAIDNSQDNSNPDKQSPFTDNGKESATNLGIQTASAPPATEISGKPEGTSYTALSVQNKIADFSSPEGFAQWRENRLQTTGKSQLDEADIQELMQQATTDMRRREFTDQDSYSYKGIDQTLRSTQRDDESGFIFKQDAITENFLKHLPDSYYEALYPPNGQMLTVSDMKGYIVEYAELQPLHDDPAVKARLDEINQKLEPYREAFSFRGTYYDTTSESSEWVLSDRQNYRFEASREDFKKALREDIRIPSPEGGHNVSGTELLAAIKENTQYGHVAGADNNKNGAFDPTKDRHGLSGFVSGFIENVIDNPVIRTVAQVAQFTPFAPVATVFNTVAAIHDTVQAVEDGDITKALASAAGAATGAGKITGSASIVNAAGTMRNVATAASIIDDPKNAAWNAVSAASANFIGHGNNGESWFTDDIGTAIAHGVTQGAIEELRGNDFRAGFTGGVAGHLSENIHSPLITTQEQRTALASVMGGLAAEISGEDFSGGARTAASVHTFNGEINLTGTAGAAAGGKGSIRIDTDTGDVYVTGGIGLMSGSSLITSWDPKSVPQAGGVWSAALGGGLGPIAGTLGWTWDASHYSQTGEMNFDWSPSVGYGAGAGLSAGLTYDQTWHVGNIHWLTDLYSDLENYFHRNPNELSEFPDDEAIMGP